MKFRIGKISISLDTIFALLFASVIMAGLTFMCLYTIPRIWICGALGLLYIIFRKKFFALHSLIGQIYLAWLGFLVVNWAFSYTPQKTLDALINFSIYFLIMAYEFSESGLLFLGKVIRIISFIYAISIFVSVVMPGLIIGPLSSLMVQSPAVIADEHSRGIYSGIVGEKAQAAFYMNIGLLFEVGLMIKSKKFGIKNIVFIMIYFLALLLTGKRMLLMVSVCIIAFFFLCRGLNKKSTVISLFVIAIAIIPLGIVVLQVVPQVANVFERFSSMSGDDTYNGRTVFWDFCLYMFSCSPFIGFGFDSFNQALGALSSFSFRGEDWNMYAHSIYYEMLGETGIIGVTIFFSLIVISFVKAWKYFKHYKLNDNQKMLLFISMGIQIIFCLYGITGNAVYEKNQLGFLMLSFILTLSVERWVKRENIKRINAK